MNLLIILDELHEHFSIFIDFGNDLNDIIKNCCKFNLKKEKKSINFFNLD